MNTENTAAVVEAVATTSLKDKALAFATNRNNQIIAGGIVGVGLAAWGAKKLWDRRQAKKAVAPVKEATDALVGTVQTAAEQVAS